MKSNTQKIIEAIEDKNYDYSCFKDIDIKCALCGNSESKTWHNFKLLSASFTDYNKMINRQSEAVCEFCAKCLNDNYMDSPNGKKCGIRLYSFLIENGKFEIIERKRKEYYLMQHEFKTPFILCFTDTGKKHISFKAQESFDADNFHICTEEMNIFFERQKYFKLYETIRRMYNAGVFKSSFLDGIKPWMINKYNIDLNDMIYINQFSNTIQYKLMVDCLGERIIPEPKAEPDKQLNIFEV